MNNLSSEAHGTEKCDEYQLIHTYNDAQGLVSAYLPTKFQANEINVSLFLYMHVIDK